jgi:acetyl esterase/lipase
MDEILLDDARRLAESAHQAGRAVRLAVWEGLFHVFPITPLLPESAQALAQIAVTKRALGQLPFCRRRAAPDRPPG